MCSSDLHRVFPSHDILRDMYYDIFRLYSDNLITGEPIDAVFAFEIHPMIWCGYAKMGTLFLHLKDIRIIERLMSYMETPFLIPELNRFNDSPETLEKNRYPIIRSGFYPVWKDPKYVYSKRIDLETRKELYQAFIDFIHRG